ncbi:MAG: NAD(P)-dependent alcohol dehydrogenase [Bacillota bacterium]
MPLAVRGYAAEHAGAPITPFSFTRRAPRPDDVAIDILYCGICHTDIHQTRNDWGGGTYPMVPGHEIIGRVAAVGAKATLFKPGELVGVGCMVDSCRECVPCKMGLEQFCEHRPTFTYNSVDRHDGSPTYGGYSERIVCSEDFVVRLPPKLDPKSAAPLLCAGITTYSPLRHWKVGKGSRVAVVGLGGLGHMGLKFAKAFGADVTLFTRTPGKSAEARRLGADHVILSTEYRLMETAARRFDLILDTVPNPHDLNPYIATLKRDGHYVIVGQLTPLEPPLAPGPLITGRRSVAGSLIGGIAETQEMLNFCAAHGLSCEVEVIGIQDVNKAYIRMQRSDVRYRFVIDMATLKKN